MNNSQDTNQTLAQPNTDQTHKPTNDTQTSPVSTNFQPSVFKPKPTEENPSSEEKKEPQIGVELEHFHKSEIKMTDTAEPTITEPKQDNTIEVATYNQQKAEPEPIGQEKFSEEAKNAVNFTATKTQPDRDMTGFFNHDRTNMADFKQKSNFKPGHGKTVAIITAMTIVTVFGGLMSGFYGFKYLPNLSKGLVASADTEITNEAVINTVKSEKAPLVNTDDRLKYTNTKYKYSVEYPAKWFGQGINNTEASNVQFTNYQLEENGTQKLDGLKIEIVHQDSKGKTLADWVQANNIITKNSQLKPKTTKINGKDALEQEYLNFGLKTVSTFVLNGDKVMIISSYAPETKATECQKIYTDFLASLNLT